MSGTGKSVGVLTTDHQLIVRSWDSWLAEATGTPAASACGRPLGELCPEVRERGFLPRLRRVVVEGTVEVLAPAFHHYLIACAPREPSAHFTHMQQHVTVSPLRSAGEIAGVVITIEDVTARLERERDLAAQLRSGDEAIRLRAAQALGEEESGAAPLADALADESWRVRRAAADGMARQHGEEAIATLVEALRERHRDPAVLNAAVAALARSTADVVPAVMELMSAPDGDVRTYAALTLGQLEDERAVPVLVAALADADTNVRYHAIEALGRLRAREAAGPLAAVAESRDFFLAFAALDALAAIGEPGVASRLVPLLDDELLQGAAAATLGRVGDEDVVAPLAALLARSDAAVIPAARALATLHGRLEEQYGEGAVVADLARGIIGAEGGAKLIAALTRATDEELDDVTRVLGWLELEGIDRVLARLLSHHTARRVAADVLARRGRAAVGALVEALSASEDEIRKLAATALGRIGSPDAVPALLALLDDSPEVTIAAVGAIARIGDRRAFEPLLRLLDRDDATIRHAAVSALDSIGHPDMPARIAELLADPSPRVRESAAKVAGYFGYGECLDRLLALCSDPDENVRRTAVDHVAYSESPRALPALRDVLATDTPAVRAAAAGALAHLPSDAALPVLLEACRDPDPWVRYHAVRSVGHHRRAEATTMLLELASGDAMPPVRIAAIGALGAIGAGGSLPALARWAEDPDIDVARAALDALGDTADAAALPPLLRVLGHPERDRRFAALSAIGRRANAAAVPALARVARSADDAMERRLAIGVLGRIAGEEGTAALLELAAHPGCEGAVIAALVRGGEETTEWIGRGLRHPRVEARRAAVEALARLGHPSASRLLATALADDAEAVRFAAARALRRRDLSRAEPSTAASGRAGDGGPPGEPVRDVLSG